MGKTIKGKKGLKIIIIGVIAMLIRSLLQVFVPQGEQSILKPSIFVRNGVSSIAFIIYATIVYSSITAIFAWIYNQIGGTKLSKGSKLGGMYAAIWVVYLFEPLPHVSSIIDLISYPIADGAALIILGIISAIILSTDSPKNYEKMKFKSILNILIIDLIFIIGRIIQYRVFNIYSSFEENPIKTCIWMMVTGIIIGSVLEYLNFTLHIKNQFKKSIILGCIVFGINMIFFNFFMPIIFEVNMIDLFERTFIDIISVTIGCLAINIIAVNEMKKSVGVNK